jgi:hypothetical protein
MTALLPVQCNLEGWRSDGARQAIGEVMDAAVMMRLSLPAHPRFSEILHTACLIYCRSLPGGEELHGAIEPTLSDATGGFFERANGVVEVTIEVLSGQLRVTLSADGKSETLSFDLAEE